MSRKWRVSPNGPLFEGPEQDQGGTGGNPPPSKEPTPEDRGIDAEELAKHLEQEE